MNYENFGMKLNETEIIEWAASVAVCHSFLGNNKAGNHQKII